MTSLAELARSHKLRLVAMTDPARGGDPRRVARRLPIGSWMIFRHYDDPDRSVLARHLSKICRSRRIRLLIAGDIALAVRLRAGLHLPEKQPASVKIRLWQRRGGLLTGAAHSRTALRRAKAFGADAALLSPVFATQSHPGARPLGLLALRNLVRTSGLPVVALGGVNCFTLRRLRAIPLAGVAVVGAVADGRPS